MTDTFATLVAAIDAGDDDPRLLPALADWLEEQGDSRAAGLRLIGHRRPSRLPWGDKWAWHRPRRSRKEKDQGAPHVLPWSMFRRLKGGELSIMLVGDARNRLYPTCSAALLALATALAPDAR